MKGGREDSGKGVFLRGVADDGGGGQGAKKKVKPEFEGFLENRGR